MAKELLVNVSRGEEVRVALVEDARLEEIYLERDSAASNVGNIYLGKVTNVEGSIQAAFVDFGYGRNGFLHVQDLHPDYFPEGGRWENMTERVGKKIGRRDRPPIQDCLRRGDHIIVQIIKEGIGTKGPTLTSYPSIPGRFLVMMPGVAQMGVSKNIEDETERRRLRKILDGLKPPKDVGFIIRTAGMGKTKAELERDFKYLTRLYEQIEHHRKHARPPTLLYSEGDLVTRTVRDVWTPDIDRVICDDPETALRIKQFFKLLMPRTKVDVQLYQGHVPLFHAAGVEAEIETMFSRHVPLPSGGSLVIDSTEAVVAIDVNSGKFREHSDAEETAFRTDMEAADEICRQLRLRDLGGVVIVDFIDLRYARHRQALFDKLTELFKRDKAKSRHLEMNEFGIVCITRQRMRPDLKKSVFMPCPWSKGTGFIKTPESMALDVMRRLRVAAADERVRRVSVGLYPSAALHVLNSKRQALADLERGSETPITLRPDESLAADEVALELFDDRDGQVVIEALQPPSVEEPDSGGRRKRRRRRRKDEEPQGKGGQDESEMDEAGLIDLPDLLPLGELKLDEVEKLVDEVEAEESAAREAASRDPQKVILEALRSGSLYEDDEQEAPAKPTKGEARAQETQAPEAEEEGGRRRKRRRRRGRRDEQEEARTESQQESAPESHERAADEEEPREAEISEADASAEPDSEAPAEEAKQAQPAQEGEERGGRRRRRRRRRGRGDREGAESSNGDTAKAPDPRDQRAPKKQRAEKEAGSPDDLLDRHRNGNRVDAQTHTMRRDPFAARDAEEADRDEKGGRRRRRRKGRGLRGHTLFGHTGGIEAETPPSERLKQTGLSDEALDAHINGNRIDAASTKKPVGVYRESDDEDEVPAAVPPEPAEQARDEAPAREPREGEDQGGEQGGRKRRRRRRRGRGGASAEQAATESAPPAEDVGGEASEQEPEVSESTEEPAAISAEAEVQEPADEVTDVEAQAEPDSEPEPEPEPAKPTRKRAKKTAKAPAKKAPKKTAKKVAKKAPKKTTRKKAVKASAE